MRTHRPSLSSSEEKSRNIVGVPEGATWDNKALLVYQNYGFSSHRTEWKPQEEQALKVYEKQLVL